MNVLSLLSQLLVLVALSAVCPAARAVAPATPPQRSISSASPADRATKKLRAENGNNNAPGEHTAWALSESVAIVTAADLALLKAMEELEEIEGAALNNVHALDVEDNIHTDNNLKPGSTMSRLDEARRKVEVAARYLVWTWDKDVTDTAAEARKAFAAKLGPSNAGAEGTSSATATTAAAPATEVAQPEAPTSTLDQAAQPGQTTTVAPASAEAATVPATDKVAVDAEGPQEEAAPQLPGVAETEQRLEEAGVRISSEGPSRVGSEERIPTRAEAQEESSVACGGISCGLSALFSCVTQCGGEEKDEYEDYSNEELEAMIILKAEEKKDAEEWKKTEEELINALAEQKEIKAELVRAEREGTSGISLGTSGGGGGGGSGWVDSKTKKQAEGREWAARKAYCEHIKRVDKLVGTVKQFRAQLMRRDGPEPEPEKKGLLSRLFSGEKKKKPASTVAEEAIQQAEALAKAAEKELDKMNKSFEKRTGRKAKGADALLEGKAVVQTKKEAESEMEEILTKARTGLQHVRADGAAKREAALKKYKAAMKTGTARTPGGGTGTSYATKGEKAATALKKARQEYLAEIKALDEAEKEAEKLMDEVQKKVEARKEQIKERIRAENASQQVENAQALLDDVQRKKEQLEAEIKKAQENLAKAEEKKQKIDKARKKPAEHEDSSEKKGTHLVGAVKPSETTANQGSDLGGVEATDRDHRKAGK